MPLKPPQSADFRCCDCGHYFQHSLVQRLLGRKLTAKLSFAWLCPKCGSRHIVPLIQLDK
jgi:tRNA(Ile2) C34 agmatinyltransferase TiaS